ncbi:MAG: hypothetical protein ACLPZR_31235 [Solirubrobacteraceae bacterium]
MSTELIGHVRGCERPIRTSRFSSTLRSAGVERLFKDADSGSLRHRPQRGHYLAGCC